MALPTASDNIFPKLILDEGGTLGTVASGERRLGVDANGVLVWKNSAGTTSPLVALNKWDATAAPGTGDDEGDGYQVGSRWIDVTNDKEYVCLDASTGAAVWTETTQSGGGGAATHLESDRVSRTAADVSTTNTTLTDVTGMSITKTTGARRVMMGFYGSGYNSLATNHVCTAFNVDGTDTEEIIHSQSQASESQNMSCTYLTDVLSAASHTFKFRFRALSGGTATINASASFPAVFWIAELYAD